MSSKTLFRLMLACGFLLISPIACGGGGEGETTVSSTIVSTTTVPPTTLSLDNWHWRNPLPQGNNLNGIVYGNHTFVTVGDAGTILTSPDGVTWTSRSSGTTYNLYGIVYSSDTFFAVGYNGSIIITSPDGITWTSGTSGPSTPEDWESVMAYGNYTFVKLDLLYGNVFASSDGITWDGLLFGQPVSSIVYGNNTFVIVGHYGNILTSPDGRTWTSRTEDKSLLLRLSSYGLNGIAYGNNTFVAVGDAVAGGTILTSPDGITWTKQTSTVAVYDLLDIVFRDNMFVAWAKEDPWLFYHVPFAMTFTSPDGITWTEQGVTRMARSTAYDNNTFVRVDGSTISTSPDGVNWTSRISVNANESLSAIAYGNNTFVVVGQGSLAHSAEYNIMLTSPDGITWTKRESPISPANRITFVDNTFLSVGGPYILTSSDGITWAQKNTGSGYGLRDITYGNNTFVAVGYQGTILQSGSLKEN